MTDELLMDAVGMIDDDLITDVEPRRTYRLAPLAGIAAAILMLIGIGVLYAIFVMPSSAVYLDSRESVKLSLNSCGRVLSVSGYDGLDGMTAEVAVAAVTRDMLDSGAIDAKENTLILGTERLSEQERATLTQTVQDVFTESRFHGAIISLPCTDRGAKAAVAEKLAAAVELFSFNDLRQLSANDLNILLHEYEVEDLILSGEPSESGYIGKAAALKRAEANTDLSGANITVTYSVYQGHLVYLVRIIKGDRAEAYFINADSGVIATALKTTPEQLEQTIRAEVKKNNSPDAQSPSGQRTVPETPQTPVAVNTTDAQSRTDQSATEASRETTAPAPLPTAAILPTTAVPFVPTEPAVFEKPTESQTIPTEQATVPTEAEPTPLLADIAYVEVLNYTGAYGNKVPFEQLSRYDKVMNLDGYSDQEKEQLTMQDNRLAVIRSSRDLFYLEAIAYDEGDDALMDYLEDIEETIIPDNVFFRDYALVIAICYHGDYRYSVNSDIQSIQISGNTAYVWINCTYPSNLFNDISPLLHTNFATAKVNKKDLDNIDTLKLIFTT